MGKAKGEGMKAKERQGEKEVGGMIPEGRGEGQRFADT